PLDLQSCPTRRSSDLVLINRGPSDISGITGRLTLPDGFKTTGKPPGTPAVATFDQIAKAGSTFTLFFDVDVLDSAKVQDYTARLDRKSTRLNSSHQII